jgi:ubiquinone/menaquinone biosynthesis C-methylase UbiE
MSAVTGPAGFDRYKASSYKAYNERLPERYDTALITRFIGIESMDDFVVDVLGGSVEDLEILDVGCATGRLLERLAESGAKRLAGTDLAPRILETARTKLERFMIDVDLRSADAEARIPWPDDSFDAVASTGVVHHFVAPEAALAEMRRVLRPHGVLVLVDPCFFTPVRELFNLCLRFHPHEGDHYFRTARQMATLLSDCGWHVDRCERINWWAFGILASAGVAAR